MRYLIPFVFFASTAMAQFSVIEYDAGARFKAVGMEWTPSFFSLASTETDKMNNGGRLSTYNYFTFTTFTGDNMRLRLRVPFTYASAGTDRFNGEKQNPQEWALQDLILCWQTSDFWLVPFDIGTYWEGRIYLPTGQHSRDIGQIAYLRNDLIFSKMFTRRLALEYNNKFGWYQQSRRSYVSHFEDSNGFAHEGISSTKKWDLDHWLNAWYKVSQTVSVGWAIGDEVTDWHRSAENNRSKPEEHLLKTGPTIRFPLGNNANFLFNYSDKMERENARELGKFLAKNTEFTLLSFVHF